MLQMQKQAPLPPARPRVRLAQDVMTAGSNSASMRACR